jgi:hypothetical protein
MTMWAMLALLFALAAGAAIPSASAQSRRAVPWCANLGGQFGYDCGYYSFEQCMETARGLGNSCSPNPWAQGTDRGVPPRGARTRRR